MTERAVVDLNRGRGRWSREGYDGFKCISKSIDFSKFLTTDIDIYSVASKGTIVHIFLYTLISQHVLSVSYTHLTLPTILRV